LFGIGFLDCAVSSETNFTLTIPGNDILSVGTCHLAGARSTISGGSLSVYDAAGTALLAYNKTLDTAVHSYSDFQAQTSSATNCTSTFGSFIEYINPSTTNALDVIVSMSCNGAVTGEAQATANFGVVPSPPPP
jgi:hypothetical protein